ncbi:type II toxin-antitoxin system mRNA interferase toxin, RelE/StbE family [Candidatus Azambacteria bacterium]|nr:type II toxin-antitoxin system mRNA interferase toxin, RelE/StbE family [Candidatus Azambacteria bacterium]
MKIELHRNFIKKYYKLTVKIQEKFKERRNLFLIDQFHPLLNNHALSGKYDNCRSINITSDIRVIFSLRPDGTIVFITIGSHSELYEN